MSTFFDDDAEPSQDAQGNFFSPPRAGPSQARRPVAPRLPSAPADDFEHLLHLDEEESRVQRLWQRLQNERNAPEILADDPSGDLNACLQTLMLQQEAVNSLRTDIANWDEVDHIQLLLVQQDNERIKWLANSLVRCRLGKIEQQHMALMQDDDYRSRLSEDESRYLDRYHALFSTYMHTSVLSALPTKYRTLDESAGMVFEPDMNSAVYVLATRECGPIRLPNDKELHFEKGSLHMLRYRSVQKLVETGELQLV